MNVTLIGMPGSGKSSVGRLLAKRLGYAFLDVDPLIEKREGAKLQAVLDKLGTERFLDVEAEVIAALQCDNTVIAPGGSAVLRELGAEHLKELGPVVYLKPPTKVLLKRLGNLATRGVTLAPGQTIQDLYDYRAPFYEKYADLVVDSDQPTMEKTVDLIVAGLPQL
jgi:shikimate kinase